MTAARAAAARPLAAKYERYAGHGYGGFTGGHDDAFSSFARDRFVIGDETYVRDELQRYHDELGATEFRFRMGWSGLAQLYVLSSIRHLGRIAAAL